MMKQQSSDFIEGYVFSKIERNLSILLKQNKVYNVTFNTSIPKIWFGLPCSQNNDVDLPNKIKEWYIEDLTKLFNAIVPDKTLQMDIYPELQYIVFSYKIADKVKKMTKEEIENALGYKIEIISE